MINYYKNPKILEITDDLLSLSELINSFLSYKKYIFNPFTSSVNLDIVHKWFLENEIYLKKLPFIPLQRLIELTTKHMEIKDILKNEITFLSPFEIPIHYIKEKLDYGEFIPIYVGESLESSELIYTEFRLSKRKNILTPLIYAHEITHSLLEDNNNSINNYINYELLPTIFERILAISINKSTELLEINFIWRLLNLKKYIDMLNNEKLDYLSKIRISSYINSLIISYQIFEIYCKEKNENKKLMLKKLNSIIKDETSIETYLNYLDISYESSLDNLSKLLKERKNV